VFTIFPTKRRFVETGWDGRTGGRAAGYSVYIHVLHCPDLTCCSRAILLTFKDSKPVTMAVRSEA
jgi:hypothetical protein